MKNSLLILVTFLFFGASAAYGQSRPLVNADYEASDGSKANIHVVVHADGSVTGSGRWRYPDPEANIDIDIDQWDISADGKAVYLSGRISIGSSIRARYVVKLIDNGEGETATEPDRESYVVFVNHPGWNLNNPVARFYIDNPSAWNLTEWFPIKNGNIQTHKVNN
jgi:hypothetical protein